jgi:Ferritin-like
VTDWPIHGCCVGLTFIATWRCPFARPVIFIAANALRHKGHPPLAAHGCMATLHVAAPLFIPRWRVACRQSKIDNQSDLAHGRTFKGHPHMSYLKPPRLHFAGSFQADPSTVNNDPEHFDASRFQSNYNLPGPGMTNGWWNPGGTAAWRFFGCTVQQVVYQDGTVCDDPAIDPVVGSPVASGHGRTEGKLVDLDPEQQMVSEIWGFQVTLGGGSSGFSICGDFDVAGFADIWVRYPQGQPDSFFGAFYQSVLQKLDWKNDSGSRFLKELERLSASDLANRKLSIKFNVDGYVDDSNQQNFTFGRVVGSIGVYEPGEPVHFVPARQLNPTPGATPAAGIAYAMIDGDSLLVDLGNTLPTQSAGGPLVTSIGRLYAAVLPASGPPILFGEIEYQNVNWYKQTSGIVRLKLTPDQLKVAQSSQLAIAQSSILQQPPVLATAPLLTEASNGVFVRADKFVFRLNPGETATTKLYATTFGQRSPGQQISLGYDPSVMQGQVTQGPLPGPPNLGTPLSALQLFDPSKPNAPVTSITTGPDGTATLQLKAADPGNPRVYIDGQLYGVTYQAGSSPPPIGSVQNGSQFLSVLVFSGFEVPAQPNWMEHVRPIFQQYADLYPVMRPIVDLANFGSVNSRLNILKNVFVAPVTDPNYMPVTRDLSEAKRTMIRKWLDNPIYMNLDSAEDLMQALQLAIELEHATIPPYLCALYSIKPGTNVEIAGLIRSIVVEEMLHMALVANIFVAIGGSPSIGHAKFVPTYPGPLPGGLRTGLIVRLRCCSIEQIRDCFMSIEEPEQIVHIKRLAMQISQKVTIGWFYDQIIAALEALSASGAISFGHQDRQVKNWTGPGQLYVIKSLDDAKKAITEIKDQGEGTTHNPSDGDGELAHYYKFAEIVAGRHIERTGKTWAYSGPPIPFDPDGVWPMIDDPNMVLYPAGSRARILAEQFAESYQALLQALNRTFNGDPDYLNQAIGLMYSLDLQARQLMQMPSGIKDRTMAGPSFQLSVPGMS